MTTKAKTKYPGITKITRADGETRYRLIITVGTRIDHLGVRREIQQCHTFRTLTEARKKQDEIRDAKNRGVLVKRDSITFDELCRRWLYSRHDIREVSRLGYAHLLKPARAQFGKEKVQDLSRADIENLIGILDKRGYRTDRSWARWARPVRCWTTGLPQGCCRSMWRPVSSRRGSNTAGPRPTPNLKPYGNGMSCSRSGS